MAEDTTSTVVSGRRLDGLDQQPTIESQKRIISRYVDLSLPYTTFLTSNSLCVKSHVVAQKFVGT
jgi:hypothetical protein